MIEKIMKTILGVVLLSVVTHGLDYLIENYETSLEPGKLVATIPQLAKSYKISFDLKPKSYPFGIYSVLHFTIGGNLNEIGDRTPAFLFRSNGTKNYLFCIAAPINGDISTQIYIKPPPLNAWTKVVVSQRRVYSKYVFKIYLNGTNVFSERNNEPQKFNNVKVFASNPWYKHHDGSIKNLILENGEPGESLAQAVLAKSYVFLLKEMTLKKSNLVAVLSKLEKSFTIQFHLKLNNFSDGYRSVIHFTKEEDNQYYGDRIPGIWVFEQKLHIAFAISGEKNKYFNSDQLPLDQWIDVHIEQNVQPEKTFFFVLINNKLVYEVENLDAQEFLDIIVYAGDPWYEVQDGSIKAFTVSNRPRDNKKSLKKDAVRKKTFGFKF
ncbi:uncharacterized protein LOC124817645 [Hydra vulgaris]|uniref:uncharacterized protein LOC124817634 n=1 Tax=Hydra vulgaris TaxID=6087 RepID=UPI001F5EF099|nr:uncharacterized protein LOC124817634 [Hydra vulgaris]XP_047143923.1 uncharacterized protein LOC124817645 [Hydra vulgaris]